jgi:hypothetical protein
VHRAAVPNFEAAIAQGYLAQEGAGGAGVSGWGGAGGLWPGPPYTIE